MTELISDLTLDSLADALNERGYLIIDEALPAALAKALANECGAETGEEFKPAGTGRKGSHRLDARTRSDEIRWLDGGTPAAASYLSFMDGLRAGLNRRLFLGLFDYECHYARYAPGAFYGKHRDAFAGERNRVLSTVFYLNEDWPREAGGELLLYAQEEDAMLERIEPTFNRFVVFLSERFPHEVRPAARTRHSIAGWFRVQAGQGKGWMRLL